MKAQLFSPLYTVIFSACIISVLLVFNLIVQDWNNYSLLNIEAKSLQTTLNLMSYFNDYNVNYETNTFFNLTINDYVNLTKGEYSIGFNNTYGLPYISLFDVSELSLVLFNGAWAVYD